MFYNKRKKCQISFPGENLRKEFKRRINPKYIDMKL